MLFSLLLLLLTLAVAYFHYVQGFFSATISAILTAIAAVVALGWYQQLAPLMFGIKFYDQAASIALMLLFAATYLIPRAIMDKLVPGNIRLPVLVEKIGAGAMGVLAGLLSVGVAAIAADALPFGPTIAGYARFNVADTSGMYMGQTNGQSQMQDVDMHDVVKSDSLSPDDPARNRVWFAQDDLVTALVNRVSDGGSLADDVPFSSIHPDFIDELYGQRLGIQTGALHSAVTSDKDQAVKLSGLFTPGPKAVPQVDGEVTQIRQSEETVSDTVPVDTGQMILIVRLNFASKSLADDTDNLMRFSSGAVRLVAGQPDNGIAFKDYHPVATLDPKGVAVACRPDDFLFADLGPGNRTIDFVFVVDKDHALVEDKQPYKLAPGTFVEFKGYSVIDLSGQQVDEGIPPNPDKISVLRKTDIAKAVVKAATSSSGLFTGETEEAAGQGADGQAPAGRILGDSKLAFKEIVTSNKLCAPINCHSGNDSGQASFPGGSGEFQDRKWQQLTVAPTTPVGQLGTPVDDNIQELAVRPNDVMVQVHCTAPVAGDSGQMWAWGKLVPDFVLSDYSGGTYRCVGGWTIVQRGAEHYLAATYDEQNSLQALPHGQGRPTDVWLAFQVPAGTMIAQLRLNGNPVADSLNFKAQSQ